MRTSNDRNGRYRIWITAPAAWQPSHWQDRPSQARVVAPAADGLFTAEQAAAFLEGFNTQLLHEPKQVWGIAVRVDIQCRGDLRPGQAWRSARTGSPDRGTAAGRQHRRRNVDRHPSGVRPSRKNGVRRRTQRRRIARVG
jgi:hypothetical protein